MEEKTKASLHALDLLYNQLLDRELKYIEQLDLIINRFKRPMTLENVLTKDQLNTVFSNVEQLVSGECKEHFIHRHVYMILMLEITEITFRDTIRISQIKRTRWYFQLLHDYRPIL
jgi:hypothetical protein